MRRACRGLSLIEILVAVLVFALGLLPVFDLFRRSIQTYQFGRDEVVAGALAHELIDQIRGMPFGDVPILSERPLTNADDGAELLGGRPATRLDLTHLERGFERYLTVEEVHDRLKKIRCRVTWGTSPRRTLEAEVLREWAP